MKFPSHENRKWYALVGGLTAVLTLLAVLQYQSSRQISDATTQQMLSNLDGALLNLRLGLEGELAPLCRELQQNYGGTRVYSLPAHAIEFARWRQQAAHPALVGRLFVWQEEKTDSGNLFRLDFQRNEFVPSEWPSDLIPLRSRLQDATPKLLAVEAYSASAGKAGDARAGDRTELGSGGKPAPASVLQNRPGVRDPLSPAAPPPSSGWMIDEQNLVLIHAVRRDAETAAAGARSPQGRRAAIEWILVGLDPEVMRGHILPELVQRNFGSQGKQAYEVAILVRNKNQRTVIYSSDSKFAVQPEVMPDASLNLFGPPMPQIRQEGRSGAFTFGTHFPISRSDHPQVAQNSPPAQLDGEPFRIDPIRESSEDEGWEVVAKHRKGSVEAAVSSLYYQSLAFNFCVLVALAVMVGMVMVTSRRARRLAQLQMDFVASVSHELRTPLTGIVAAAQNIADGLIDDKTRMARYGNAILGQAQQLGALVEQILLFSATDKNRHRYHLQPASVQKLIDASLASTSALIRSARVKIECNIQPALPPVTVDFKAFSQCLQNLIANAVKYGGDQRWVGIKASQQTSPEYGDEVLIAVEDRGMGIEEEDLKHVFEPFYRSPAATAVEIHGSGLGLPLVKSITEAMGGRLTIDTAPKKGSTFTVHLPLESHREGNGRS